MVDDLSDAYAEIRKLQRRVERLESGSSQESMSLDRGRTRIGDGEFLVDGDGLFRLVGTFDQTGTYNVNDGGNFNLNNGGNLNVNSGGDVAVNSGGDLDINDGGNARINDGGGLGIWDGGVARVHTGGLLDIIGELTVNGSTYVRSGGEIVVDGPDPVKLSRENVLGSDVAAIVIGPSSYIYGVGGVMTLHSTEAVNIISDTIRMPSIPDGTPEKWIGVDSAGKLVKASGSGGGGGGEDLGNFQWPFDLGSVSSEYGPRDGGFHEGIDFALPDAPSGAPIIAAGDGEVVEAVTLHAGWGNYVRLVHELPGGDVVSTLYAHMINPPPVSVGQTVTKGDVIGHVGNTGNSFGAHLHWETWAGTTFGSHMNPRDFMALYGPE